MSELCRQGSAPFEARNTVGPLLLESGLPETRTNQPRPTSEMPFFAAGIDPGAALPRVERLHEDRNRKRRPVVGLVPADLADCAARKSAAQQLIHGGDTARAGTTDLALAKANEDIEAALELLREVGGSHIRLGLSLGKFGARLQSCR